MLELLWSEDAVDAEVLMYAWREWKEQLMKSAAVMGVEPFNPLLLPAVAAKMQQAAAQQGVEVPAPDKGESGVL